MSRRLPDGTVVQPGLGRPAMTGPRVALAYDLPAAGIVAVHHVDSPRNVSKSWIEVDVMTLRDFVLVRNVAVFPYMAGDEDGEEWVPQAGSVDMLRIAAGGGLFGAVNRFDGDLVMLAFADRTTPFVFCGIPRVRRPGSPAPYASTMKDGRTRTVRHRGTTIRIGDDGSVTVTTPTNATMSIVSGDETVAQVSGGEVRLGGKLTDAAMRRLVTEEFLERYHSHIHPVSGATTGPPDVIVTLPNEVTENVQAKADATP